MIFMPYKPPSPCACPGCPALSHSRYCEAHASQAHRDYNRNHRRPGSNSTYGRRWRAIRDLYIAAHPLCERCLTAGRCVRAEEVHHAVPVAAGGTHADDNLRALCKSCHSSVTLAANNAAG
jgi:5-methylcytosine-specific restriction protein A